MLDDRWADLAHVGAGLAGLASRPQTRQRPGTTGVEVPARARCGGVRRGLGRLRGSTTRAKLACDVSGNQAGGMEHPMGPPATQTSSWGLAAPHRHQHPVFQPPVNQPQSIIQHSLRRQRLRGLTFAAAAGSQRR